MEADWFVCCQTFKENPYFNNKVLKKEYKYVPPQGAADETPDEDGLTTSMIAFNWEEHVKSEVRWSTRSVWHN